MTSADRAPHARGAEPQEKRTLRDAAPLLWITGLSGVGKSTLADALAAVLRARGAATLQLDGDRVRLALDPPDVALRHDVATRRMRAWRLARLAALSAQQGVPTIVATISLFHDVQQWLRDGNPRYGEILLTAPLALLRARDPERYGAAAADVVGIDQEAQFPLRPESTLVQDYTQAARATQLAAALAVWDALDVRA